MSNTEYGRLSARPLALLWDIDGTLIDTTALVVGGLDYVYRTFIGRTIPPDEIRALVGTPLYAQIRYFGEPEEMGIDPDAMEREFIRYWEERKNQERLMPEVIDTLIRGKRAGIPTALVTSKNLAEIANTLPRMGIADCVDTVVSSEDVVKPKPDPEGILLACKRFNVSPGNAVYIGDTVHDMRAGKDAGVITCAVTWGAGPRPLLVAENPDILCDEPQHLAAALGI